MAIVLVDLHPGHGTVAFVPQAPRDEIQHRSTDVERKIVSMAPEQYGWRIEVPEHPPVTISDMPLAILVACNLARAEHRASGMPTAVKVSMLCGDGVMMGFFG